MDTSAHSDVDAIRLSRGEFVVLARMFHGEVLEREPLGDLVAVSDAEVEAAERSLRERGVVQGGVRSGREGVSSRHRLLLEAVFGARRVVFSETEIEGRTDVNVVFVDEAAIVLEHVDGENVELRLTPKAPLTEIVVRPLRASFPPERGDIFTTTIPTLVDLDARRKAGTLPDNLNDVPSFARPFVRALGNCAGQQKIDALEVGENGTELAGQSVILLDCKDSGLWSVEAVAGTNRALVRLIDRTWLDEWLDAGTRPNGEPVQVAPG